MTEFIGKNGLISVLNFLADKFKSAGESLESLETTANTALTTANEAKTSALTALENTPTQYTFTAAPVRAAQAEQFPKGVCAYINNLDVDSLKIGDKLKITFPASEDNPNYKRIDALVVNVELTPTNDANGMRWSIYALDATSNCIYKFGKYRGYENYNGSYIYVAKVSLDSVNTSTPDEILTIKNFTELVMLPVNSEFTIAAHNGDGVTNHSLDAIGTFQLIGKQLMEYPAGGQYQGRVMVSVYNEQYDQFMGLVGGGQNEIDTHPGYYNITND